MKVVQETSASLADAWSTLTDFTAWSRWGPWDRSEIERAGRGAVVGLGAIRRLHVGRRVLREETTLFEPERELRYRVLSGIPVRDYEGVVSLDPTATKVRITWSSSWEGWVPRTNHPAQPPTTTLFVRDPATRKLEIEVVAK